MRATQLALRRADARVQERGAHCGVLADGRHRFFSVRLRRRALTTDPGRLLTPSMFLEVTESANESKSVKMENRSNPRRSRRSRVSSSDWPSKSIRSTHLGAIFSIGRESVP